jgi:hypothetical protein
VDERRLVNDGGVVTERVNAHVILRRSRKTCFTPVR